MSCVNFTAPLANIEFADSGAGDGQRTMRGHAAVFNRLSHDLGGYKVKIAAGAFTQVLDGNPDVHLVWDHDTRYVLGRTKNKTLELREDPLGLHVWGRFAKTTYADDLAALMERGDIDQMSFACDIGSDTWTENDAGITRTIEEVSALYDVTICAQGAFPQTDSSLVADLASAIEAGRVAGRAESPEGDTADNGAAQEEPASLVVASQGGRIAVARARARLAQFNR